MIDAKQKKTCPFKRWADLERECHKNKKFMESVDSVE